MQLVTLKYFSEPPICQAGLVVSTGESWDKLNLVSALREREKGERHIFEQDRGNWGNSRNTDFYLKKVEESVKEMMHE